MKKLYTFILLCLFGVTHQAMADDTPAPFVVTSLSIINADTNAYMSTLTGNVPYDIFLPGLSHSLNFRADVGSASVGSVRFFLNGSWFNTENVAPFAFAGDISGNYVPWTPSVGQHTIKAIAYSGSNGSGTVLGQREITLNVFNTVLPPTNFVVTNVTNNGFQLAWTGAPHGNDYRVEYSTSPNSGFSFYDASYFGINNYNYGGLSAATTYYFRVRTNYQGVSSAWNSFQVTTLGNTTVQPPTNFVISDVTANSFHLDWTPAPNGNDYLIQYSTTSPNSGFSNFDASYFGINSFDYGRLNSGTTYYFRVRTNLNGVASAWNSFEVTTLQGVSYMALIDADTNAEVKKYYNSGYTIDKALLPVGTSNNLNFKVDTGASAVSSVRFLLNGSVFGTENVIPFAFAGDINGNYYAWNPPVGTSTITAILYSGPNASGSQIATFTINLQNNGSSLKAYYPTAQDNTAAILDITIYPNPASELLFVHLPKSELTSDKTARLFSLTGQLVKQETFSNDVLDLDVSDISKGAYFLRIDGVGKSIKRQVLIE